MKIVIRSAMDKFPKSCLQCEYCGFYGNHWKSCVFNKDKAITITKRPKHCPLETICE